MELLDCLFDIARRRDRKIVSPQVDDARIAAMVRQREPQLAIDGEFQADATLVPVVSYEAKFRRLP